MVERFIDLVISFIEDLLPFKFVYTYSKGAKFRGGTFIKIVGPGICWKYPLLDKIETTNVVETTLSLPSQSLTTLDNKSVTVKGIIKYNISDLEAYVLNVWDAKDALSDIACAVIKSIIAEKSWIECIHNDIDNLITKKIRINLRNYGITVIQSTLIDISLSRSIRLFNEHDHEHA